MKMRYKGAQKKTVKLPTGTQTSDKADLYMTADVAPGDIASFDSDAAITFAQSTRCIDGSCAWEVVSDASDVTITFQVIHPKAPSRRTSWKARGGKAKS